MLKILFSPILRDVKTPLYEQNKSIGSSNCTVVSLQ